jgi:hypothetical protein
MDVNYDQTRLNSRTKFLDLKINLLGAIVAANNYTKLKLKTDYETKRRKQFPKAERFSGTGATVVFTPTPATTWTIDEYKDKYAVFWKSADTTTLETSTKDFHNISNVDHQVQKVVSNTATTLTVGQTIMTGATAMIIIDDAWFNICQLSNYDFANSKAEIDTNDSCSGGVESFILGLESAQLSGTGHFFPTFHTHAQLNKGKDATATLEVRHGATDMLYDTVYNQKVLVNDFSKPGANDGTGKLEYNLAFSNTGEILRETILVNGEVPTFM